MTRVFLETSDGAFRAEWGSWKSSRVLARTVEGPEFSVKVPLISDDQLQAYVSRKTPQDRTSWGCFLRTADFLDDPWAFGEYTAILGDFADAWDLEGMRDFVGIRDTEIPVKPKVVPRGRVRIIGLTGDLGVLPPSAWDSIAATMGGLVPMWMLACTCRAAHDVLWERVRGLAESTKKVWGQTKRYDTSPPTAFTDGMRRVYEMRKSLSDLGSWRDWIGSNPVAHFNSTQSAMAPLFMGIRPAFIRSGDIHDAMIRSTNEKRARELRAAQEDFAESQGLLLGPQEPSLDWVDSFDDSAITQVEQYTQRVVGALRDLRSATTEIAVARAVLSCSV